MLGHTARLLCLLFVLTSATANASALCSANPVAEPSQLYNLQAQPLERNVRHELRQFARQLAGRWHGRTELTECKGPIANPREAQSQFSVRAEIDQASSGAIRLDAEKLRTEDNVLKLERLFFSPELNKYRLGQEQGWHTYTLQVQGPGRLVFAEKYRVRNQRRDAALAPGVTAASRVVTDVKVIQLTDDTLTVDRQLYVNGLFVAEESWQLQRS